MRPFKQVFEKNLNDNMQVDDGRPGCAPPEAEDAEIDIKKSYKTSEPDLDYEYQREKKDPPPRFSTLYGAAPPPISTPVAVREYQRDYYPRPQRKSGVFMPMPLFILFAVILFLETTILFAYTVIGLYNNAPSRIFPWAGPGSGPSPVTTCSYQDRQSGINFAPNFIMPGVAQPQQVTQIVTMTAEPARSTESSATTTISSTSSSSTSTTYTTTTTPSADIDSLLSRLAIIVDSATPSASTTATPSSQEGVAVVTQFSEVPRSTTTSLTVLSVDSQGNVLPPASSTSTGSETTSSITSESTSTTSTSPATSSNVEDAAVSTLIITSTPSPSTSSTPAPSTSTDSPDANAVVNDAMSAALGAAALLQSKSAAASPTDTF